jgi:predicted acetyltransferase
VPGDGAQMTDTPLIRQLTADDNLEDELELRRRAFGPVDGASRPEWLASLQGSVAAGRILGAFAGAELVGTARYHDMRQWWHGSQMPMAGVAGVKVAPEARGTRVGSSLMTTLLSDIASRGYPVSVLFPSTSPIYRSLGWEFGGAQWELDLPVRSLGSLAPADLADEPDTPLPAVRRAGPQDAAAVISVLDDVYRASRACGPTVREPETIQRWLGDPENFAYLAGDGGFVSYGWDGKGKLWVDSFAAASRRHSLALWRVVSSHASMATKLTAVIAPDDPISWLVKEPDASVRQHAGWMLRIVDAQAAIALRGYRSAAEVSVRFELSDAQMPANAGTWQLSVSGGKGGLEPATAPSAAPPLRLGIRGLSAAFCGVPLTVLRTAGLVAGGTPADDEALECAFAGSAFLLDYF